MKGRYFIYLSYDGTAYHGWQRQPNARSVQQVIEEALSLLLRLPVTIVGAGRTDTGVHARLMVAHFDMPSSIESCSTVPDEKHLSHKLNRILPPDISVYGIEAVTENAHARFDAFLRTYRYYVCTKKSVFFRHYMYKVPDSLDFDSMNKAAQTLLGTADFTSFSKSHTDVKTNICCVSEAQWTCCGQDVWRFEITADRFLRNMVRAIVGTLLDVGRGKLSYAGFKRVVEGLDRGLAGESVPGRALFLVNVKYPDRIFVSGKAPSYARLVESGLCG